MSWTERSVEDFFSDGQRPDAADVLAPLDASFDLVGRLADTEQDPEWHAEGDVWTHTCMVVEALHEHLASLPTNTFDAAERAVLTLGAALHDIAKPLATRRAEVDGRERVVAPRHADLGRSYSAPRLAELNWPFERIWQVLALIGHHHDPLKLVRRDEPVAAYLHLARQASPALLHALETADMRGRICPDLQEQLDMLELFALQAEDCGEPPYHLDWLAGFDSLLADEAPQVRAHGYLAALRDAEAGHIASAEEGAARAYRFRQPTPHLILLCGPSGSGKSTWIEANGDRLRGDDGALHVVSLDDLRTEMAGRRQERGLDGQVAQEAKKRLKEHLAAFHTVIWDATNLRREFRRELVTLGEAYGAVVSIVAFLMSPAALQRRNRNRPYPVPSQVLDGQLRRFDFPYAAEAHRLVVVDEAGAEQAAFPIPF